MELIIKIIFILSLFMCNVNIFSVVYKLTDEVKQKVAFGLLAGFNVLATTTMLYIMHPYMAGTGGLAFAGFLGGAVIFAMSVTPFQQGKTS